MKRFILPVLPFFFLPFTLRAQPVQGEIIADTGNITVVKVYGSHEERAYATGYLLADQFGDIYNGYIKPLFGSSLPLARQIIQEGVHIRIDSLYHEEAKAMLKGAADAGLDTTGISYLDVLVSNSMLDLMALGDEFVNTGPGPGCSSLMSWGDATAGTDLDGKSVISRHLDWTPDYHLTSNQVMVIHIPDETNEQPWLLIGFAGQIFVLSGLNASGLSCYQHMMSDFTGQGQYNKSYEPVWLTLRKALESKDFNGDGDNNTLDVQDAILDNPQGFADGYIITASARAGQAADSLIALVAEVAPLPPLITFRSTDFPDSIPGDNLYAANYEIRRNNHYHFCPRYLGVKQGLGQGTAIGSQQNWDIMRLYSNSGTSNIQFMQFVPEWMKLNLSVYDNKPAYQNDPVSYDVAWLFSPFSSAGEAFRGNALRVFPNPAGDFLFLDLQGVDRESRYVVYDLAGIAVKEGVADRGSTAGIFVGDLGSGMYIIRVVAGEVRYHARFVKP
jgi:hypothetical protein